MICTFFENLTEYKVSCKEMGGKNHSQQYHCEGMCKYGHVTKTGKIHRAFDLQHYPLNIR